MANNSYATRMRVLKQSRNAEQARRRRLKRQNASKLKSLQQMQLINIKRYEEMMLNDYLTSLQKILQSEKGLKFYKTLLNFLQAVHPNDRSKGDQLEEKSRVSTYE